MKIVADEESVPLLGSNCSEDVPTTTNEKNPYQLISTHDIREISDSKREIRNLVIWRICFVVIILSVMGLLATSAQMGIQFYVTSLKSTSIPPSEESSPIGGIIGALKKHPPIGKMTSPRVFPVKSLTVGTTEDVDETSSNNKVTFTTPITEEQEKEEEDRSITTTDSVVMPGSPSDPSLVVQREKKNSVHSSIGTIPANDFSTATKDVSQNSIDENETDTSKA